MQSVTIQHFHDPSTGTLSYVLSDPVTGCAAVIDPVLGYSAASGRVDHDGAERIMAYLRANRLTLQWILETHAHADHLSAAIVLREAAGGNTGIGVGICEVQAHFSTVFNLRPPFATDGRQFDRLFADNDCFMIGERECRVMQTPGHTSDSVTYVIGDAAFIGDTMFMPDLGTARCDFPGGDASRLYDSVQRILALPAGTRLFMCHDYPPEGRPLRYECSIAEQKAKNIHIGGGINRADYVAMRNSRDAELNLPALILPAIQVNIRAGHLPPADDNGVVYLKIPLNLM